MRKRGKAAARKKRGRGRRKKPTGVATYGTMRKQLLSLRAMLSDERHAVFRLRGECDDLTRQLGDALRERDAAQNQLAIVHAELNVAKVPEEVPAGFVKSKTAASRVRWLAERSTQNPESFLRSVADQRDKALADLKAAREAEAAATAKLRTIHGLSEPGPLRFTDGYPFIGSPCGLELAGTGTPFSGGGGAAYVWPPIGSPTSVPPAASSQDDGS